MMEECDFGVSVRFSQNLCLSRCMSGIRSDEMVHFGVGVQTVSGCSCDSCYGHTLVVSVRAVCVVQFYDKLKNLELHTRPGR